MSKNASNVRVALTGNVWHEENLSATILPDISGPPTGTATELGYTTPDGVTFQVSRETEDLGAWQTKDPLRILLNNLFEQKVILDLRRDLYAAFQRLVDPDKPLGAGQSVHNAQNLFVFPGALNIRAGLIAKDRQRSAQVIHQRGGCHLAFVGVLLFGHAALCLLLGELRAV